MSTLTIIILAAVALVSYLIGAIPWGYLIGKKNGVDIRTLGSKEYRRYQCYPGNRKMEWKTMFSSGLPERFYPCTCGDSAIR